MAELKREYVVPLRRKTSTAPKWRRSKKAMSVLKEFIEKHMKTDNVVICPELNEKIWNRGIKHPPGKVEVIAQKLQVGSEEKTLVNLVDVGLDAYIAAYQTQPVKEEKAPKEKTTKKEEKVVEAEAKEVKKEKTTEAKAEKKEEEKTDDSKKEEVKKDE